MNRTYLHCHVYDCPEDQRNAARAALAGWAPWGQKEEGDPESPLDGRTARGNVPCDTVPDIAAALRKAAPGASWVIWEEPSDDSPGPGRSIAFTPALGEHEGECDASGDLLLSRSEFEALRSRHPGNALITAIDHALGGPWEDHYSARVYAAHEPAPRLPDERHNQGTSTANQFGVDEPRLADLAARYPVEDDRSAFLALQAAIQGDDDDPAAVITGGPCDLAVELLADADGQTSGYRLLVHPAADLAAPWIASNVEEVIDRDMLAEPTEDGGTYDTAQIVRDAAITANGLLTWDAAAVAGIPLPVTGNGPAAVPAPLAGVRTRPHGARHLPQDRLAGYRAAGEGEPEL